MTVGDAVVSILKRSQSRHESLSYEQIADAAGPDGIAALAFEWTDDTDPEVRKWLRAGWEADSEPENDVVSFSRTDRQAYFVENGR